MAKKVTSGASTGAAAKAAPVVGKADKDSVTDALPRQKTRRISGAEAEQMLRTGVVPPPPAEAFEGVPGVPSSAVPGPRQVRRGGRLMGPPAGPVTPPDAQYRPGRPYGVANADYSAFPTAVKRRLNPTFHAPPPEVEEARGRAVALRAVLGQALGMLEHGYHEAMQSLEWLKANPSAAAEFTREGVDLEQVRKFADEADDVINLFAPPEEGSPAT